MFHVVFLILLWCCIIIDSVFFAWILWFGFSDFVQDYQAWVFLFLLLQIPIGYILIYLTYIAPIQKLNKSIARFYTGLDEDPNMMSKTLSTWMNNITFFFQKSLQILRVFKDELRDWRKLRSEVELAGEIQKQTLSQEEDCIPGLTMAIGLKPAWQVGWDSMDVIVGHDGNYYLYIGDVTGHGVASGFVMMMVNALISAFANDRVSWADILARTNIILKPRIKTNMMMTCVMLRWDSIAKKMYFTGAGHEFILVYKARDKKVYKIKSGWVALGMMRDISKILKEQQIAFEENDLIILYTDGITEARYRSEQNGILFGVERIIESIMGLDVKTPETVFRKITTELSAFMGYKHVQYDDITLAIIGYGSSEKGITLTDIPERMESVYITEWNWGKSLKAN